jgi:hypothetical protein
MISSRTTMMSAYFSRTGFGSIEFLPQGQKYNPQYFSKTILPSYTASLSLCCPKLKSMAAHLHIDNAKSDNSELSI